MLNAVQHGFVAGLRRSQLAMVPTSDGTPAKVLVADGVLDTFLATAPNWR